MKLKKTSNNSSAVVSRILRSSTLAKRLSFESSETKDLTNNMEKIKGNKKKKKSKVVKRRKIKGSKLLHNKTVKAKQHKKMNNVQTTENIKLAPIFEKPSVTVKGNKKMELTELPSPIIYHGESFNQLMHCHIQQLSEDLPEIEKLESKFNYVALQEYESISHLGWSGLLGITDIVKKETLVDINKQNDLQNLIVDLSDSEDFTSVQKSQSCKRKKKQCWRTNDNVQKISRKKKSSNNEATETKNFIDDEINKLWVEKHRPEKSENVIDNNKAIEKLKEWLNYWKDKNLESANKNDKDDNDDYELSNDSELDISNCTIIFGPSGAGKTNLVYCLAQELGFRVFEVNASSTRSGRQVTAQLREATQSHHVEGKVLTLDELLTLQAEKMKTIGPSKVRKKKFSTIKDFWNGSLSTEDFKTSKSFSKKNKSYKSTKLQLNDNFKKLDSNNEISIIKNNIKEEKNGLPDKVSHNKGLSISSLSVILFDDVDVIFEEDEGFWNAVNTFLRTTKKPVILTASTSLHSIKHHISLPYELITLELPTVEGISNHLINICQKENLKFSQDKIQQIISYVGRDIRKSLLLLQYWYYTQSKNANQFTSIAETENCKYQNMNDKNSVFDVILGIKNKNNYFDLNEYLQNFVNIVYLAYSNNFSIMHNNLSQLITSLLIFEKSKNDNVLCQKSEETYNEVKKEIWKREKSETKNATITSYFQITKKKSETTQLKISSLEAIADLADKISLSNILMYPIEQHKQISQEYSAYNSSVLDTISYFEVLSLKNTLHKLQRTLDELQDESKKLFFPSSSEIASNPTFVTNMRSEFEYNDNVKCFNSLRKAIPPVTCLQKTAICTDYLSNIRNICKSEKMRKVQNSKRSGRFLHYLDSISLLLDKDIYYLLHK